MPEPKQATRADATLGIGEDAVDPAPFSLFEVSDFNGQAKRREPKTWRAATAIAVATAIATSPKWALQGAPAMPLQSIFTTKDEEDTAHANDTDALLANDDDNHNHDDSALTDLEKQTPFLQKL